MAILGCTSLLDLDAQQCSTTADCRARGSSFQSHVCVSGSCVPPSTNDLDGGTGDAEGQVASGCVSTEQCVRDNLDEPFACLTPGQPCVPLKSEVCPLVFGDFANDDAVRVGALLDVPASAPLSQMSALNVQLAVDEINGSVGGLPGGTLGAIHPLVVVVCRNGPAEFQAGAAHLIEELKVPAVIAHLASADIKTLFVDYALPHEVFVMNPGFADNSLTSLSTQGLFWHVIGDIRDVAPAYGPLMTRTEAFLRPDPTDTRPIRVAMIVSKRYAEESIADRLTSVLRFNGKDVVENGENFYSLKVPALVDEPNGDYATATADLLAFEPDVVVAITREELVYKILPVLEDSWPSGSEKGRPFYLLPTALSGNLDLLAYLSQNTATTSEDKRKRISGVAPASAEDMTLYNEFLIRFRTAYPHFQNPGGFENFYDATYLLAYAMYAARSVPSIIGPDIARGMERIIDGGLMVDIGPTALADGFTALAAGGNIRLNGTMGPSDFDPSVGARKGNGSVYCVSREDQGLSFAYDVLRYDDTHQTLEGDFVCVPGF